MKVAICESNLLQLKDTELRDAIKSIAPQWWGDDTRITLNINVCCQRHTDSNKAHSWIIWFGNFIGGALVFDDGVRIDEKYTWHRINGQTHHWNEPHVGTKYSIILYQRVGESKGAKIAASKKIKQQKETEM
jgi:hypothetical protein